MEWKQILGYVENVKLPTIPKYKDFKKFYFTISTHPEICEKIIRIIFRTHLNKFTVENITNSIWSCKVVWFLAGQ